MLFSWGSLFFLPDGSRDAQWANKMVTGRVTLVFCVIAGVVWYLQKDRAFPCGELYAVWILRCRTVLAIVGDEDEYLALALAVFQHV